MPTEQKYKSARELMEAMNTGEIPREHIGKKSVLVLKQELFSLENSFNYDTMSDEERDTYYSKMGSIIEEISKLSRSDADEVMEGVDKMLNPTS